MFHRYNYGGYWAASASYEQNYIRFQRAAGSLGLPGAATGRPRRLSVHVVRANLTLLGGPRLSPKPRRTAFGGFPGAPEPPGPGPKHPKTHLFRKALLSGPEDVICSSGAAGARANRALPEPRTDISHLPSPRAPPPTTPAPKEDVICPGSVNLLAPYFPPQGSADPPRDAFVTPACRIKTCLFFA